MTDRLSPLDATFLEIEEQDIDVLSEAIESSVAELASLARTPETPPPPAVRRPR